MSNKTLYHRGTETQRKVKNDPCSALLFSVPLCLCGEVFPQSMGEKP